MPLHGSLVSTGVHTVTGIKRAVEQAGGAAKLGAVLGVSHQAVYVWIKRGWVPNDRAVQIEQLYAIPRADLVNPKLAALFGTPTAN
jgi:DNA-binding transcriptional regulator YdaS (Cro superfamily)